MATAVQVLKYNKPQKSFELDIDALERILLDNDVRESNIAIVSIAGAFRKGKSFMLSFFLRYLNAEYVQNNSTNWLGADNSPLAGFSWRGGSNRHTTGIWVWSKVFTKTLPNGEKIGVMLMDTQGTFDSSSTMKDNVTIFSLSTMLSSVQIYNLFHNIQEDDLQHLQLFTEYGKLASEQNAAKPFQKLLFLVRDWSYPYEYAFGSAGGKSLLTNKLQITEDQDEELSYVRTHLKSFYEDLDCFLMPYPGSVAIRSQAFNGQLKDLDPEFKESLKELVPMLLAPNKVLTKRINGVQIKGKNLLPYIEIYWNVFKKGVAINAKTILGATSEANNLSAKEEASDFYELQMRAHTAENKPLLEFNQIVKLHENETAAALNIFAAKAIMGDDKLKLIYRQKLQTEIQGQLMMYIGQNELKKKKNLDATITNLSTQINSFQASTASQTSLITTLQSQVSEYQRTSEAEKAALRQQIEQLRAQQAAPPPRRRKKKCVIQ